MKRKSALKWTLHCFPGVLSLFFLTAHRRAWAKTMEQGGSNPHTWLLIPDTISFRGPMYLSKNVSLLNTTLQSLWASLYLRTLKTSLRKWCGFGDLDSNPRIYELCDLGQMTYAFFLCFLHYKTRTIGTCRQEGSGEVTCHILQAPNSAEAGPCGSRAGMPLPPSGPPSPTAQYQRCTH